MFATLGISLSLGMPFGVRGAAPLPSFKCTRPTMFLINRMSIYVKWMWWLVLMLLQVHPHLLVEKIRD